MLSEVLDVCYISIEFMVRTYYVCNTRFGSQIYQMSQTCVTSESLYRGSGRSHAGFAALRCFALGNFRANQTETKHIAARLGLCKPRPSTSTCCSAENKLSSKQRLKAAEQTEPSTLMCKPRTSTPLARFARFVCRPGASYRC